MVVIAAAIMVTGIVRLTTMPAAALPATAPRSSASPVPAAGDIMLIGLTADARGVTGLSALAGSTIVPRLRGLPGVRGVSAFGPGARAGQVRGEPGVVLIVREAASASVPAVSREVDQALAAMAPALRGVAVDASLFRGDPYLKAALGNLRVALITAAVLAALALLALLLQLRLTFTALFGMALSLVTATAVLDLLGYTFNAIVALGLLLALALVVTEAVCEAQAIASRIGPPEHRSVPAPRLVAAACGRLRGSLTAAGLAALLCVVPLLLATGRTASFLRPMAVAFALAVIAAMVVAVTVTPALAAVLLTVVPPAAHGTPLPRRLTDGYARSVGALVRKPRLGIACAAGCAAVGVAALAMVPALHARAPAFDDHALIVALTGPPRASLTEMDQLTARAANELLMLPSVQDVGATVGTRGSELWVTLRADAGYGRAFSATRAVAASLPGVAGTVTTTESESMAGLLTGPNREPLATRIAVICYVIAAIAGVLLLAQAATWNWRLALLAFASLPVSAAGAVFTAVALGAAGQLAAAAGLLAVLALAARQAIAVASQATVPAADAADGAGSAGGTRAPGLTTVLVPAVLTAVAMTPFAAMGSVPGMELLHTTAAVILGGLVTTTLVGLFALPALVPRVARTSVRRRFRAGRI